MKIKIKSIGRLKRLAKIIRSDHHTVAWRVMGFYIKGNRATIVCPGEEVSCTVVVDDMFDASECPDGEITFGVEADYLNKMILASGLSPSDESVLKLEPFTTVQGERHYRGQLSIGGGRTKIKIPMFKASDGAPMPDKMDDFSPGAYTTLEEVELFVGYGKHVWSQAQKYSDRFAEGTNVYIGDDGVVLSCGCPSLASASKLTTLTTRPYPDAEYRIDQTFNGPVFNAMDAAAKVCCLGSNEEWVVAKHPESKECNDSYSLSSVPDADGVVRVVVYSLGSNIPFPSVMLHKFFEPKCEPMDDRARPYADFLAKSGNKFDGLPDGSAMMTIDDFKRLSKILAMTSSQTTSAGLVQQFVEIIFEGGQPIKVKLMGDEESSLALAEVDVDLLTPCAGDFPACNFVDGSNKLSAVVKHALMIGADEAGFAMHFQNTSYHTSASFGFVFLECNSPLYQNTRIVFSGVIIN